MDVLSGNFFGNYLRPKRSKPSVSRSGRQREALLYAEYFTDAELDALCNYKNKGCDKSITYKYVMSKLYDRWVHYLPMWMAPNLVTMLGFIAVFTAHVILSFYAPTLSEEAPRWVYALNFVGLFLYMVLDNLDGRQARRTKSSSPLGHLFDHTCDAINVTITGLTVATTLRLGNNIATLILVWFFGMSVFVTATIEEFYTGALVLREINGANEGLIAMQCFYLTAALFGTNYWLTPIQITSSWTLPLGKCILFMVVPVSLPTIISNYVGIYTEGRKVKRNTLFESLKTTIPFAIASFFMFAWAAISDVMTHYPYMYMWACALTQLHIVSYIIVAHLCDRKSLPSLSMMVIPLGLGTLNALVGRLGGENLLELPLLFGVIIVSSIVNITQAYRIGKQICDHLNIHVFSIEKPASE